MRACTADLQLIPLSSCLRLLCLKQMGNRLGARNCVRMSKLYRQHESGNSMKGLLGVSNLAWNPTHTSGGQVWFGMSLIARSLWAGSICQVSASLHTSTAFAGRRRPRGQLPPKSWYWHSAQSIGIPPRYCMIRQAYSQTLGLLLHARTYWSSLCKAHNEKSKGCRLNVAGGAQAPTAARRWH